MNGRDDALRAAAISDASLESSVDPRRVIDEGPVGRIQVAVVILCGLVVALEGFDAQAIGYVAPSLNRAWHLHPGDLGPAISAGLLALMAGALIIAPLADRLGRRPVLIWSTVLFGVGTLTTFWAHDLTTLTLSRIVTGLGIGGAMPNALALTGEFMPSRRRAFLIVMMFNGFNIGSMSGGILSAVFLNGAGGWRYVFLYGGVLPLLLAPALAFLPESLSFLATSKRPGEAGRALRIMRRLRPQASWGSSVTIVSSEPLPAQRGPRALFAPSFRSTTLLLWLLYFLGLLDVYLLVSWVPTAMQLSGVLPAMAVVAGIVLQVGAIVASFTVGWSLDRFGSASLAPAYLLAALCIVGIGFYAARVPLSLLAVFGAGFGVVGSQAGLNALATISYPTALRSTGVGWAVGMGRIGSVAGPLIGGALLNAKAPIALIFSLTAVPAIGLAVLTVVFGNRRPSSG